MEILKETKDYTVFKKRSGRYAVKGADGKMINKDEKVKILLKEGVVKTLKSKPKPAPVEEEVAAEEEAAAPVEETPEAAE